MAGIHAFPEIKETLVDVELLELPFSGASQVEITEEVEDKLTTFVNEKLNSMPRKAQLHFTISRVPTQFREKNKTLYEPAMVSIGPFYHGKESLRAMEEHKWRFLQSFLERKMVPMKVYLKEMRALEPIARRCYNESISLGPDEFSLMLLLDGCFILEYFLRFDKCEVFQVSEFNWTFESLQFDLFLLENQIPFFVIHKLFTLWFGANLDCQNRCPFCDLIFRCQCQGNDMLSWPQISCNRIRHLLQFYYESTVPRKNIDPNHRQPQLSRTERVVSWLKSRFYRQQTESSNRNHRQPPVVSRKQRVVSWMKSRFYCQQTEASLQKPVIVVIPCATKLHVHGVTFKRKNNPSNMFDITFTNGVFEMPRMDLNPYIRVLFRNLYSYEQNLSMQRGIFTSFTNLMDSLVNTEKDVVLLERCGILENMFQNEEEAAAFFNELNDFGFIAPNHHLLDLFIEVQKYSESTWPRYRARLMHDYLNSPWSLISVFAGVLLLSLTVVQTIFGGYSTFHH